MTDNARRIRTERLGWDLATGALFCVIALLAFLLPEDFPGSRWALLAVALGIVAVYAFGARRYVSIREDAVASRTTSMLLQGALVALLAIGTSIEPNMLILQTIVLPLIWMTSRSTAQSVLVTLGNAVILGLAYSLWGGFDGEEVAAGFLTSGLSAAFSIALGLWITRIAEWGAERQRLLAELTAAQHRLEAASREAGAGAERARIARDIHDTIAQSLTSIVMLAERARRDGSPEAVGLIEDAAREALQEARALVAVASGWAESGTARAQGPASLSDALRRLGERFARETGVRVEVEAGDAALPRDIQVVLLRCAQEGLANVRKHAGAASARVTLAAGDAAELSVRDDGRGGASIDDDRGFGLAGMRDRVALVGGTLAVADAEGGGTVLSVRIPLVPAYGPADAGASSEEEA